MCLYLSFRKQSLIETERSVPITLPNQFNHPKYWTHKLDISHLVIQNLKSIHIVIVHCDVGVVFVKDKKNYVRGGPGKGGEEENGDDEVPPVHDFVDDMQFENHIEDVRYEFESSVFNNSVILRNDPESNACYPEGQPNAPNTNVVLDYGWYHTHIRE